MNRIALLAALIPFVAFAQTPDAGAKKTSAAPAKAEGGKFMKMAREGKRIWMKLGALDYKECVADDIKAKWGVASMCLVTKPMDSPEGPPVRISVRLRKISPE